MQIHGTNLITVQLLTIESPVVVAICNVGGNELSTYLVGSEISNLIVTSIQKWNNGFPEGYSYLNANI